MKISQKISAFTLVELLTVIAIIGILAAIIIPTVGKIRASAEKTTCASNLRQIALAVFLYANDNKNRIPNSDPDVSDATWTYSIRDYIPAEKQYEKYGGQTGGKSVFICPARLKILNYAKRAHYGINFHFYSDNYGDTAAVKKTSKWSLTDISAPTRTILLGDACAAGTPAAPSIYQTIHSENLPGINPSTFGASEPGKHGAGAANIAYADGHVSWFADTGQLAQSRYKDKEAEDLWNIQK
ncbi:prepilin-type N-terminal cleavage/methylation domain-containing protein [Opitutaceae bacterium TAV1]|nr:prepilin-type N-terminal cleavage/methylation domain-containing protein [Opitutaceae bacterium TAV1]